MKPIGVALPARLNGDRAAPPLDQLVTAKQLAASLGMSLRWIHERTRRGEIPRYRFGAAVRFDPHVGTPERKRAA